MTLARPTVSRRLWLAAILLLALLAAQTVLSMRQKSPTCDEFAHHIANGYSYLVTSDFRMNPASPPLARAWPTIPLRLMGAKLPLDHLSWKEGDSPEFARQFFYHANGDCVNRFVFWARTFVVLLSLLFGLVIFRFARRALGDLEALLALSLYVFSPNIIAHSGLATADLMVAFFFFLTCVSFWGYLRRPGWGFVALTGAMAGLTFLSKFSAVVLFPTLLLWAVLSGQRRLFSARRVAAFLAVCFFTIWAGYAFEVKPLLKNTPDPAKKEAYYRKIGGERLVEFARNVPVPLSTFASSIVSMGFTRKSGTDAFLMGEWSRNGWWYYYFVALGMKETIPLIFLTLLGWLLLVPSVPDRNTRLLLTVPVVVLFGMTLGDRAQAGVRYFLLIFPMFFLTAAAAAGWIWRRWGKLRLLVLTFFLWHAAEAVRIYPDYLAYFNQSVGGPSNGYKYLRDSNLDWAQDLKGVGAWAREQKYPEVVVMYHGIEDPAYYGIPAREITQDELIRPKPTVYAIGAHRFNVVKWTSDVRPTHVVGHSFFIYDMRQSDTVPPLEKASS